MARCQRISFRKNGNDTKKLTWKEAEKRIRTLIENKEYPYIHQEAKTETRENVPNFGTPGRKKGRYHSVPD